MKLRPTQVEELLVQVLDGVRKGKMDGVTRGSCVEERWKGKEWRWLGTGLIQCRGCALA